MQRKERVVKDPDIFERIAEHEFVYEALDKFVPPFRITRPELKVIYHHCKKLGLMPVDQHYDDIRYWMGVQLEVVTIG